MKKVILFLFIIPQILFAQEKGMQFEHNTSWEKVKSKAKVENKFIFVDCFTTWCGPCRWMSTNIFPQEKVGDFFNANFVNLKIQMDQTNSDSDDVRFWYDEARRFEKDYAINAYPTFLIFSPEGELVHRIVGGGEADEFIAKAKAGLNPETQYVTLVRKFETNRNDVNLARNMALAAKENNDKKTLNKAIESFVNLMGVADVLTPANFELILSGVTSSNSVSYALIRDNKDKVNVLVQEMNLPSDANDILSLILMNELVMPKVYDETSLTLNFDKLQKEIEKAHPYVDMTIAILHGKTQYYIYRRNWKDYKDAVNEFVNSGDKRISPQMLNSFAWAVFENCADEACLQAALAWSKKSLEPAEDAAFMDTYANLLYKSGDKENAIAWQEKALKAAASDQMEELQATLDKMKVGKPTWN